jgi:DNA-binding response OmpR family regulator
MKVLIIEDDYRIVESVSLTFQVGWPNVQVAYSRLGLEGVDMVGFENPDIVILDLGLPDVSGFEVLKQIRNFSSVPIIILTVRSDEQAVVKALEWGADDYVLKPFRSLELLARIKAAMRKQHLPESETCLNCGSFNFFFANHRIEKGNRVKHLTSTESLILYYLVMNRGKVVTHANLAEKYGALIILDQLKLLDHI